MPDSKDNWVGLHIAQMKDKQKDPAILLAQWVGKTQQCMLDMAPITVTTRMLTFFAGSPYKPSFATVTGRGPHPKCR